MFGFWLKRYCICTPHFNRKNELIFFRGRKSVSTPKFWSPDLHRVAVRAARHCVLDALRWVRVLRGVLPLFIESIEEREARSLVAHVLASAALDVHAAGGGVRGVARQLHALCGDAVHARQLVGHAAKPTPVACSAPAPSTQAQASAGYGHLISNESGTILPALFNRILQLSPPT